jgi:hypothetical protein
MKATIEELTSDDEARKAIAIICAYLKKRNYADDKDGQEAVRDFCHDLLDAADVEDHGGCPLCLH